MRVRAGALLLAACAALTACGGQDDRLPGQRIDVGDVLNGPRPAAPPEGPRPISLPAPVVNSDWTHKSGAADHAGPYPALDRSLTRVWSADIGAAAGRRHQINADPVVAGGRVFTLDAQARVTALSTAGEPLWSRDLTPVPDRPTEASGGGLATEGGRLYVTTGFGRLVALDAATGAELWSQDLDAAASGAPTVRDGMVYAVSRDSRGWALDAATGRVRWTVDGVPDPAGIDGGAAPAVTGRLALFPLSSGELVAALREGGTRIWTTPVVGGRRGVTYATISDITGDPVVVDGVIYSGNPAGRTVAIDAISGERLWSAEEGAMSPPTVAGGSVFVISDRNELVRLDESTGDRIWGTELPYYVEERPSRRQAIHAHYGPVLAGGRLLVASDEGRLRSFDPVSGALTSVVEIPGGASSNPVVAGRTLYVVSRDGELHAFR